MTLGVLLAVGVATIGVLGSRMSEPSGVDAAAQRGRRTGPIALPPVKAPEAGSRACEKVIAALPKRLTVDDDPVPRRKLVEPAPQATVAWGDAQHEPIIVRCGLAAPAELKPTSRLMVVSGVSWLPISEGGKTTWLAADRPVFVALTASQEVGIGPVQTLSSILKDTLPKQDPFP